MRFFSKSTCDPTLRLAHSCIDDLEDRDGEGGCLSRSRLRLGDGVAAFADLHNSTRLHSRRRLVSVGIDAAQQVLLQVHGLEGRRDRDLFGGGELHLVVGISVDSVRHVGCGGRGVIGGRDSKDEYEVSLVRDSQKVWSSRV